MRQLAPAGGRSRSCRRRSGRSSGCSWARSPRPAPAAASAGACGCAARSPRRAWPSPGRRRTCRARRRSARGVRFSIARLAWFRGGRKSHGVTTALRPSGGRWCRCRSRRRSPSPRSTTSGRACVVCREQGARRGQRVGAARSDRHTSSSSGSIRSPVPERRKLLLRVDDDQHRFEPAQDAIRAPVLGELDGRALEIAAELLELLFEAADERKGVRPAAGEPCQHLPLAEPPHLARAALDDGALIHRDLPVARHAHLAIAAHEQDRG